MRTTLDIANDVLQAATERIMLENGFEIDVSPGVTQQLSDLERPPPLVAPGHALSLGPICDRDA